MSKQDLIINMDGGYPKTYTDNPMNRKLGRVGKPIIRKKLAKTTIKKECPPGKVISPKGRCVKDKTTVKPVKKKLRWAPDVVSPPDSRAKLHRIARKLSDETSN